MIGIYKFVNKINGKIYIGQSNDIQRRIKDHYYKAHNPTGGNYHSPLHLAIRKYGWDNFQIEVLEECNIEELDEKEIYYIQLYNSITPNGYNIMAGGQQFRKDTSDSNKKRCSQCGKIIDRKAHTGLCLDCYRQFLRKDIPTKEELKQLLIDNNGNFTKVGNMFNVSSSSIVRWCKSYNLPYYSEDYKIKKEKQAYKRPVNQIDKNTNEIIATYESSMDAARALGKKKGSHITEVCKGIHKTAYGYKWQYAE